jgi:RND superfamily putative drug exporter
MFVVLGRSMFRWRWPVLVGWAGLAVAGGLLAGQVVDRLAPADGLRPDAESQRADRRIEQLLPAGETIVAVVRDRDPYDPPLVGSITRIDAAIRAMPGVASVDDLYTGPGGRIGADNRSTLVRVELAVGLAEADRRRLADGVVGALRGIDAPQVLVGGPELAKRAFADQAIRDAAVGESIALGVLLIVLVLTLGGPVVGAIPLLAALGAVAGTLLGLRAVAAATPVGEFTVNVVTLLGIGLAVDYALLMIARFREERAADPGAGAAELLGRTTATAGRAVLVSGLAVGAAMLGLSVFAEPLLASMALGGALVVVLATGVGLTAVPALIAVTRDRIPAPRPARPPAAPLRRLATLLRRRPDHPPAGGTSRRPTTDVPPGGLLGRLAGYAQRRPGPVAIGGTAGLLLLAAPFVLGVNLANSDARALPRSMEARQVYDVLSRDFEAGRAAPVVVVVEADPATATVRDLMNRLNRLPQVIRTQVRPDVPGTTTVLDLTARGTTGGPESRDLVRAVRALDVPAGLLVGGPAAELVDYGSSVSTRLPVALTVLLATTGILLFGLTGSVVVPVKALVLNGLTLLAALGALVVVFQWGFGASLLGVEPWGGIDLTTPVLLFVFVFGLSMDYEVFLLARIMQEWDRWSGLRTRAARAAAGNRAVLAGVTRTGPVLTAAAGCICVVFLGFLLGELTAVKEIGFGMVVAVLLDVTVVRGLLLPAVMSLLGEWNWWAPAPLRRLHARWSVGRRELAVPPAGPAVVADPRAGSGAGAGRG